MDFQNDRYSKYKIWIREKLNEGYSWNDINYGLTSSDIELQTFLLEQEDKYFWSINQKEWHSLVSYMEDIDKKSKKASISDLPSFVTDEKADYNKINIDSNLFKNYINKLESSGFSYESIENIKTTTKRIFSRLKLETNPNDPIRGIVVGNIQSGKTANMAALITLAADYGFNFFIVLSGTIENLRKQTETRLFNDINSKNSNVTFELLDKVNLKNKNILNLDSLSLDKFTNKRYLNVCLKNKSRLRGLLDWINDSKLNKAKLKVLIIDDEADQAGINTANIDKDLATIINTYIKNLVFSLDKDGEYKYPYKAVNYIGYTATPYANFLNEAKEESLYPKHFIATLSTSKEYFGPSQIFGVEGGYYEGLSIINTIDDEDEIDDMMKGKSNEIPQSLRDALSWFIISTAIFRYWNLKKSISMLIHTSQKQEHHANIAYFLERYYNEFRNKINVLDELKIVFDEQTNKFTFEMFKEQYFDYSIDNQLINKYPTFNQIKDELLNIINEGFTKISLNEEKELVYSDKIHLCIDNCDPGNFQENMVSRLIYPHHYNDIDKAKAFIVIGGSTLSRGLTIEGLVSSYFLRSTKQADSLMQMGRFFGYRKHYELLPRIWISYKEYEQFKSLVTLDEALREELHNMELYNISPSKYGPRILTLPSYVKLKITSKNKSQKAYIDNIDYSNFRGQTTTMFNDEKIIEMNLNKTIRFINGLGSPKNNSIVNEFLNNSFVWFNINYQKVFEYLSSLKYPEEMSVFSELDLIKNWFYEKFEKNLIENFNIVLSGISKANETLSFDNFSLGLGERSKLKDKNLDKSKIYLKNISSPKDRISDINFNNIDDKEKKYLEDNMKLFQDIRYKYNMNKKPLLIIYIFAKNSFPKSITRENLNLKNHLVGYEIYIPRDNQSNRNTEKMTVKLEFKGDTYNGN